MGDRTSTILSLAAEGAGAEAAGCSEAAGGAAGIGAIAAVTQVWHIMLLLFPIGLAIMPVNASIATLTQTLVSDELRGRIGAALQTMIGAASITSMALAGVLAGLVGVRNVFLMAGVLAIIAGIIAIPIFGKQLAGAPEVAEI